MVLPAQDGADDRADRVGRVVTGAAGGAGHGGDASREWVVIGGETVRYEASGRGPAVVLVHGLGGSPRWWREVTADLERDHRVIVPQLPGFGHGLRAPRFDLDEAAAQLGRLIEHLELGRPAVAGHSLGALVALRLATARPDLVGRLALIAPPVRTASPHLVGNAVPLVRTILGLGPTGALTVLSDIARRPPDALLGAALQILAAGDAPGDGAPAVPVLVLIGERDALVPAGVAAWSARALPGARVVVLPDAGHMPMLERPAAVAAELRRLIDGA